MQDLNRSNGVNETEDMQNDYDNIVDAIDARVEEYNKKRTRMTKVTVFDYITFSLLLIMFLFFLWGVLSFFFLGLTDHIEGNEYGAGWYWAWCVMSSPTLLLFGIPSFIVGRRIIKYRKFLKNQTETEEQDNYIHEMDTTDNNGELKINGHIETEDFTNMRIITRKNVLRQKTKSAQTIEWIAIICLAVLFLFVLVCTILGAIGWGNYLKITFMNFHYFVLVCSIYGIPLLLILGIPLLILCINKIMNHKQMNKMSEWCLEDNRLWATVKDIDFIDYKYAKDVFWVVCDIVKEEKRVIYRYTSFKVKEDLVGKINLGQEIAVYINPDNPGQYYVNLDEVR